ncbi:hypothetical protein AVEN_76518-1 [Araneus ventricosus]|uniref:Uncharacterized protein n=1 Tax=Araneus ventricosus TaxID=182803 RepID=A0A4Y2CF39_ARAVE|nr:hypothetical protein AVEN_76518-1 [Araneus ventricosus]
MIISHWGYFKYGDEKSSDKEAGSGFPFGCNNGYVARLGPSLMTGELYEPLVMGAIMHSDTVPILSVAAASHSNTTAVRTLCMKGPSVSEVPPIPGVPIVLE